MKINLDLIYPVGSIYINVSDTIDPNVVFGGTWELIKNRFLIGAGGEYSIGTYGGEKTHTLTINEMPNHRHDTIYLSSWYLTNWQSAGTTHDAVSVNQGGIKTNGSNKFGTNAVGGGQAHNNMPPYLAVYIWKRIA